MSGNLDAAAMVKETPVLFIQGSNDKLIRPAGTWKLFERLSTLNRQMVLSKNCEHLIFEEGQFSPDDMKFVLSWIDSNIAPLDSATTGIKDKLPVVASKEAFSGTDAGAGSSAGSALTAGNTKKTIAVPVGNNPVFYPTSNSSSNTATNAATSSTASTSSTSAAAIPAPPPAGEFKNRIAVSTRPKISYWIELNRSGKIFPLQQSNRIQNRRRNSLSLDSGNRRICVFGYEGRHHREKRFVISE